MPFTGVLGTGASRPANIELGVGLAQTSLLVSVSESLNLSETASYPRVDNSASDTLTFSETAIVGRRVNVSVSDQITFGENQPVIGPHYENAASVLHLLEQALAHLSVQNVSVSEGIILVEAAGRRITVSITEVLALAESTKPHPNAADIIALIEAAIAAKLKAANDVLDLAESLQLEGTFGRAAADMLTIVEAAGYFVLNPSIECRYTPFIGAYSGAYTPPPATPPTLGTATLTLTHPFVSPSTTLVLRNPDIGNTDKLTFNRLNQQTRGGTLTVFADPQWPKFKSLSIEISAIPDDKRDALLAFLEASLGQEIGLLDWEGRQWRGIITNPDTAVTQNGRCNQQVSIDFEGDLA